MRRSLVPLLLALSLFGVVLGLKLDVVHRFVSDMPIWDQWDAEGIDVYVPSARGELTLEHLIRPHNEHRVALTRLLDLIELAVNGQWDARLQCVVNAGLHALFAVVLFWFGRRLLGVEWSSVAFLLLVALIGLPISWENLISGFHSQQYFLLLLSLATIALLPTSEPWSGHWWFGFAAGLLVLLSMASGLLAAVAAAAVSVGLGWKTRRSWRSQWPTFAACALCVAIGVSMLVRHPGHERLMAQNASEFFHYVLHSLEWPTESPWAALIFWAPVVAVACCLARRDSPNVSPEPFVLVALGGWTVAQITASAYARGADGGFPASRYMDTLAVGLLVNALGAMWLLRQSRGMRRLAIVVGALVWTAIAGSGVYRLVRVNYREELPTMRDYYARCEANVRAYLATDDASQLKGEDFPYPNPDAFRERLSHAELRAILPASIRSPLPLQTGRGGNVLREVVAGGDAAVPARHWTSAGGAPGTWESVAVDFPQSTTLLFRFARTFDQTPATTLEWRDTRLGASIADVLAARQADGAGFAATVRIPAGRAQLVAHVDDPARGFTFEGPVEVARFSALAARFAALGRWIALVSGLAGIFLLVTEATLARR